MSQFNAKRPAAPVQLEIREKARSLSVDWDDGHRSTYPWWYLRGYCPCAVCQGHGAAWDFVANEQPSLSDIEEVGQYALNIIWDDGHRTGIYDFESLRILCPCDACRKSFGPAHPWERLPDEAPGRASTAPSAHTQAT